MTWLVALSPGSEWFESPGTRSTGEEEVDEEVMAVQGGSVAISLESSDGGGGGGGSGG